MLLEPPPPLPGSITVRLISFWAPANRHLIDLHSEFVIQPTLLILTESSRFKTHCDVFLDKGECKSLTRHPVLLAVFSWKSVWQRNAQ